MSLRKARNILSALKTEAPQTISTAPFGLICNGRALEAQTFVFFLKLGDPAIRVQKTGTATGPGRVR